MPPETDPDSQNPEPKQFISADEVGNIVNAAVTSHLRRALGPAIEAALAPTIAKLNAPPPALPPGDDEEGKKKGKQTPELAAMAQKLADMEKALKDSNDAVASANKKTREQSAMSELRSSLDGKVRPELLDFVTKHLFIVDNRIEFDETNGSALFKSRRPTYAGSTEYEDINLPLKDGAADWLKSDLAKAFLPAPAPGGSSTPLPKRGSSQQPAAQPNFSKPATTDAEKVARAHQREQAALARMNGQQ